MRHVRVKNRWSGIHAAARVQFPGHHKTTKERGGTRHGKPEGGAFNIGGPNFAKQKDVRAKSMLGIMMAAAMMSPQTVVNPNSGQTMQQEMIADIHRDVKRFGQRKGRTKGKIRLKGSFIDHNQRQKRKRWRQSPHKRRKAA